MKIGVSVVGTNTKDGAYISPNGKNLGKKVLFFLL